MGRAGSRQVTLWLDCKLIKEIDRVRIEERRTRTNLVETALWEWIAEWDGKRELPRREVAMKMDRRPVEPLESAVPSIDVSKLDDAWDGS